MSSEAILGVAAIINELNEVLDRLPNEQTFWDLPIAALGTKPPERDTPSWWVWRAWSLIRGVHGVGRAIAHKTLHHQRPGLFPMLDEVTSEALNGAEAWVTIHQELHEHANEFQHLEEWFASLAHEQGDVRLTRLRIHDILLWGHEHGDRDKMISQGLEILQRS